jgi:hypothetical protein
MAAACLALDLASLPTWQTFLTVTFLLPRDVRPFFVRRLPLSSVPPAPHVPPHGSGGRWFILTLGLSPQQASGERRRRRGGTPGWRGRDTRTRLWSAHAQPAPAHAPRAGAAVVRFPGKEVAVEPLHTRGRTGVAGGAGKERGKRGAQQEAVGPPDVDATGGIYCYWNYRPDGCTRRSRCFPPGKEEGSGHQNLQRVRGRGGEVEGKKKSLLQVARCLKPGPRYCSGLVPAHPVRPALLTPASRVPVPRARERPRPSRGTHLARGRRATQLVHARGERLLASRRCPCPCHAPQPRMEHTGLARLCPAYLAAHVKGPIAPRDSGCQTEPPLAFTPQTRPEASGCLGPSAPTGVWSPDFEPA